MGIPTYGNAVTACTYHVFYNQIQDLVLLQSALTLVGNTAMAFAAYRIAASNGWKLPIPSFLSGDKEVPPTALEASVPVDEGAGNLGGLLTAFAASVFGSYLIKYGGAALPF